MINSVRLCEWIDRRVDLLKVDIEGSEFGLIRDLCCSDQIELVKNIVCEIHGNSEMQDQFAELLTSLQRAGFRMTVSELRSGIALPGPDDPTPFSAVESGKFLLHLYAWRPQVPPA